VTERIGAERAVLVGQSYGGQLVSYFVARHPELVERAVLTSPGGIQPQLFEEGRWLNPERYPVPEELELVPPVSVQDVWGVGAWPPRAIATVALATTLNVKLMSDEEADGFLNDLASRFGKGLVCDPANVQPEEGGGGLYAHGWSNWFGGVEGWREGLAEADVPLLVLHGQCDFVPYATAYEHAAIAPRGEYRFLEGAGHELWWDRPDAYVEELRRFLRKDLPAREASATSSSEQEP
jgi:pimeloyl-ACP methyl ester carboxylesterase